MDRSDAQSSGLHNVVTLQVVRHVWSGIHVHDIRMKALPGRSWHPLNCDRPVLSIVVNELRGQCEARLDLSAANTPRQSGRQRPVGHISLIPAGVPAWGYSEGIDQVGEVRLVLDVDRMKEIMGEEFTLAPLQEPRLVFNDESLQALARLLVTSEDTAECSSLFGESLVAAMVARLSNLDPLPSRNHRRLASQPASCPRSRILSAIISRDRSDWSNWRAWQTCRRRSSAEPSRSPPEARRTYGIWMRGSRAPSVCLRTAAIVWPRSRWIPASPSKATSLEPSAPPPASHPVHGGAS